MRNANTIPLQKDGVTYVLNVEYLVHVEGDVVETESSGIEWPEQA